VKTSRNKDLIRVKKFRGSWKNIYNLEPFTPGLKDPFVAYWRGRLYEGK
jgi:hypothetical protein